MWAGVTELGCGLTYCPTVTGVTGGAYVAVCAYGKAYVFLSHIYFIKKAFFKQKGVKDVIV